MNVRVPIAQVFNHKYYDFNVNSNTNRLKGLLGHTPGGFEEKEDSSCRT